MPVLRQSRGQPAPNCPVFTCGIGAHAWTSMGCRHTGWRPVIQIFGRLPRLGAASDATRRRPAPGGSHVAIQKRAVHREALLVPVPVGSSRRHAPSNWLLPGGLRPACCRVGSRRYSRRCGGVHLLDYALVDGPGAASGRAIQFIATQCTFRYRCCRKNSTIAAEASGPAGSVYEPAGSPPLQACPAP